MMTFEEFFKKKKIELSLLKSTEPALFAEFERHFAQMGEKSFDHTKKYWFNPLRRKYPLPPEVKTEKVHIENPVAEQTVIDSLTEPVTPAASVGFKPRFKASLPFEKENPTEAAPEQTPPAEEKPAANVGFKPRFKAGVTAKPAEQKPADLTADHPPEEKLAAPAGFKPRFKAGVTNKPVEENAAEHTINAEEPAAGETSATPPPAVGFKPRFKAGVTNKPVEEKPAEPEVKKEEPLEEGKPAEAAAPAKPAGFKPRFNAAKMKPKEPGEE